MPQYAILADHSPEVCPTSNSREPGARHSGPGPGHAHGSPPRRASPSSPARSTSTPGTASLSVVDAPSIEAVTQLVHATGMSQWNTVEVCPVLPLADMMGDLDAFPIVFG